MSPTTSISRGVRLALYGTALVVGLQGYSPLAHAREGAGLDDARTLDRVEVQGQRPDYRVERISSATKTDTPLVDVPQSITVVTEATIEDQAMRGMADVVRYVPGVQMAQGEGHRDAPILRGNTSTADFFVNGVRDDVQYFRDLYNVERVEVLKGPSGMIFGRGGTGGLINRVTKQADWTEARELSVTLGSWNQRRVTGDFGHALSETAAFRITGLFEGSESFRDQVEVQRWAVNPTLTFRASDATSFEFGYEHFEDDRVTDRGVPSQLPLKGVPLDVDASTFFGSPEFSPAWARVDALSTVIRHDFGGDVELINQTRYADYDKLYSNVYPGAYTAATGRVSVSGYDNFTARKNLINQTDVTFSARTGAVDHAFLVGAEFSRQETDNLRRTAYFTNVGPNATADFVTLANPIYTGPVTFRPSATDADNHGIAKTAAVYVQDQITFSPAWEAVVGVRYDRFDVDLLNRRNGVALSSSDDLVSPRVGVIYKPMDRMSIYANYSMAYVPRAGEQLASLTPSNRTLDPEKFTNREVGLKWDFQDRLAATAAIYQLDRTNVAITDPNNPAQSLLVDGQRVKGVELGLQGHLTDAWQVMAGYAYQDSEVQTPGAQDGNRLGQVPENSLSIWNRYDFNAQWGVGLGAIYQGDVYVSTDNAVVLPDFTRFDAAVFYTLNDSLRVQLNVENLLDEEYYASAHSNNNITPGSPRAFRLGLNLRF